jgi:MFS family permease
MDMIPARFVFICGICCTIAGSFLAMNAVNAMLAYSAAALMGAGFGWTFVALNTTVGHFYGPVAFPNLIGTMFLFSALACSPAGLVGGRLFDAYRSYRPAFILIIAICVIAIMALAFAKMPQKQRKTAALSG